MLVKDVMHSEFICIHPQASLYEAAEKMVANRAEVLLVMDSERWVGVVGLRDLFTAPLPARYGMAMFERHSEAQLVADWKTILVSNVMNDRIRSVKEESSLLEAAATMVNTGKHPLPVRRAEQVVGVIDRGDVVRALLGVKS
jgi:CBS domain-containing protein